MKIEQPIAKLEFESGKVIELTEEEYRDLVNYFSNMFLIPSIPNYPTYPVQPNPNPIYPQSPTYGTETGTKYPPEEFFTDNTAKWYLKRSC